MIMAVRERSGLAFTVPFRPVRAIAIMAAGQQRHAAFGCPMPRIRKTSENGLSRTGLPVTSDRGLT